MGAVPFRHQCGKLALPEYKETAASHWWLKYLQMHSVHVSAVTVFERVRGYAHLWRNAESHARAAIDAARIAYLGADRQVRPVDALTAIVAAELAALIPEPPTLPKRTHRYMESRAERLARWRFDGLIAATALVNDMTLVHNNAADFEAIRTGIEINPARFPGLGPLQLIRCVSVGDIQ